MNLLSFVDELVKVGGVRCMYKRGADISSSEPPSGFMMGGAVPPSKRVAPDEAATRVETTGAAPVVSPGMTASFGNVSAAKKPIDRDRFNRPITERR